MRGTGPGADDGRGIAPGADDGRGGGSERDSERDIGAGIEDGRSGEALWISATACSTSSRVSSSERSSPSRNCWRPSPQYIASARCASRLFGVTPKPLASVSRTNPAARVSAARSSGSSSASIIRPSSIRVRSRSSTMRVTSDRSAAPRPDGPRGSTSCSSRSRKRAATAISMSAFFGK